eukprot:1200593-Amphidinium_carterae.1
MCIRDRLDRPIAPAKLPPMPIPLATKAHPQIAGVFVPTGQGALVGMLHWAACADCQDAHGTEERSWLRS